MTAKKKGTGKRKTKWGQLADPEIFLATEIFILQGFKSLVMLFYVQPLQKW